MPSDTPWEPSPPRSQARLPSSGAISRGLPISVTIPHWYGFERNVAFEGHDLRSAANWDALRASSEDGFRMPLSVDEWRRLAEGNEDLAARAKAILDLVARWQSLKLISIGVGTGMLEHQLKLNSADLVVRCGDYASAALAPLRAYLAGEATVEEMDLRQPSWVSDPHEIVLLHRVDMELADLEWMNAFERMAQAGVQHLIIVPCGLLSAMTALRQGKMLVESLILRRRLMRNGWVRSPRRLVHLFSSWYTISDLIGGDQFEAWGLTLKSSQ
jgi:hypothetical protein